LPQGHGTGVAESGGILETGAGPVGLNVHGQTDTLFSVAPAVEVGGQFAYGNGTLLRPFARAGVRAFSEDNLKATASFFGSPAGVPAFTVTTPLDQWMGEVSTGLEVLSSDRYDGRISYEGRYGEHLTQHGGNVKIRAKF
jgi:outer membrane autotransporter protein